MPPRCSSIEILESRIAPATLDVSGGGVTYTAGGGTANALTLSIDGSDLYHFADTEAITLTAAAITAGFTGSGTTTVTGPNGAVSSIIIQLGDQDDTLNVQGLTDPLAVIDDVGSDSVTFTSTGTVSGSVFVLADTVTVNGFGSASFLTLTTDNLAISSAITATSDIAVAPLTGGRPIHLGAETAGQLSLTATEIGFLQATSKVAIGTSGAGAIAIDAALTFSTAVVSLKSGGAITESGAGKITGGALAFDAAGVVTLNGANNVATIGGRGPSGVAYSDIDALTVGTVDSIKGVTAQFGAISLTTLAGDLGVTNANAAGADISARDLVQLTAGAAGSDFGVNIAASAGVIGGTVTLKADHLSIGASVEATNGVITLEPFESATAIALGGADAAGTLGITDTELDFLKPDGVAGKIVIGTSARTSPLTMTGALSPALSPVLELSGSTLGGAGGVTVPTLSLKASGNVTLNGANDVATLTIDEAPGVAQGTSVAFADASGGFTLGGSVPMPGFGVTTFNAGAAQVALTAATAITFDIAGGTPGANLDQLMITGGVALANAPVTFHGTTAVPEGTEAVIVNNDGTADAINGTFAGLPEGSVVSLGNGQTAVLSYLGGDGNDVSLTFLAAPLNSDLAISSDGRMATFSDVDGDLVTVKTTKGGFAADGSDFGFAFTADSRQQLQKLTLDAGFTGANVTITAKRGVHGGNSFVNVGFIDATGVDLGAVSVAGDLGRINAGTVGGDVKVPALKALTVESMGLLGTSTQLAGGSLTSTLQGALSKLTVKGDVRASFNILGTEDGKLVSAVIGGAFTPAAGATGLSIVAEADIVSLKVVGDIRATTTAAVGISSTLGSIGALTVGGGIFGANATHQVSVAAFGQRLAPAAGADTAIKSLKVTGSVEYLAVSAGASGVTNADASIGSISVGGDWAASSVTAGAKSGLDTRVGTQDDAKFSGGSTRDNAGIFSTIGSFFVKGQALGTSGSGDMFGVVAEKIAKAQVGARKFAFTNEVTPEAFFAAPTLDGAGTENPAFDFTIRELGSATPAVVLGGAQLGFSADNKTATFTDVDGDLVTVKRSAGEFVIGDFAITTVSSNGGQLDSLRITPTLDGKPVSVTITAKPGPGGGNGFVNIGDIDASGGNLGVVSIAGDVSSIGAGTATAGVAAVSSLTLRSLGRLGLGAGATSLSSVLNGSVGKLTVSGDVRDAIFTATGGLGSAAIGGALSGATAGLFGQGVVGSIKIGGSVLNARIGGGAVGAVTIGGDLVGDGVTQNVTAFGQSTAPVAGVDMALKSLTVKGGVEGAVIAVGASSTATNADASIGILSVGRAWLGSSAVAGVLAGVDGRRGTSDDVKATGGTSVARDEARFSSIASITIKGQALGSATAGDSFGIVAEQIGAAKIGTVVFKFDKGERDAIDAFALAPTGPGPAPDDAASDFFIREVIA